MGDLSLITGTSLDSVRALLTEFVPCLSFLTVVTAESGWTPDQTDMYVVPEFVTCGNIYPPLLALGHCIRVRSAISWSAYFLTCNNTRFRGHSCNLSTGRRFLITTRSSRSPWVRAVVPCGIICDFTHVPGLDFSTMEEKLERNQYSNLDVFVEDVQLVFDNCRIYNPDGSIYARNATKMEKFMKEQLASYRVKQEEY